MSYTPSPYAPVNGPDTQYVPVYPAKRMPDRTDRTLAILTLAASWLYAFAMVNPGSPLAALLLTLAFYGIAFFFVKARKLTVPKTALWLPVSTAVFSLSYLLQSFEFVHFLAFQWAKFSCLWFLCAAGGAVASLPGESLFTDAVKTLFVQPFCRFGGIFPALFHSEGNGNGKKTAGWIALGLVVGLIPCAAVVGLLSYDAGFSAWLDRFFDENWMQNLLRWLLYLVIAVPVSMYFFSSLSANGDGINRDLWKSEDAPRRLRNMAGVPVAFGLALMVPVLAVYAVFFFLQWDQYLYAFLFRLPEAFGSYAEYAREGFFELCAVAFVNALLMFAAQIFLKKGEKGETQTAVRVFQGLYAVSTLLLLATALAKMLLYVHYYGLTPNRVYATWFMLAVALVFVILLVSLFWKKLRLMPAVFAVGILFFSVLCVLDTHTLIARYNIRAYETHQLAKLDIDAMYELEDSAAEPLYDALKRGVFDNSPRLTSDVHNLLCMRAFSHAEEKPQLLQMTPFRLHTDAVLADYREKYMDVYDPYLKEWERSQAEYADWEEEP